MKINAFLAIRLGSQRIPYKNFRLLAGKPLYTYLADTAKNCQQISHLFINTDSQMVIDIVQNKYGDTISYYLRPSWLGTSEATLDDYVYDFMSVNHADYTVFLNPCSIFLKAETIDKAITHCIANSLDACVASYEVKTHCFYNDNPINFSFSTKQPRSQDLTPVHAMTSGFFIWKNSSFMNAFSSSQCANFNGAFFSYPVSRSESVDIDLEEDFIEASRLLGGSEDALNPSYIPEIQSLVDKGIYHRN